MGELTAEPQPLQSMIQIVREKLLISTWNTIMTPLWLTGQSSRAEQSRAGEPMKGLCVQAKTQI